jgi:hypothetical protein
VRRVPFTSDHNDAMFESIEVIRRCKARGGNLKRLFSVLYRCEKDVDKPQWDGRGASHTRPPPPPLLLWPRCSLCH